MARIARTALATALVAGGGALLVAGILALSRDDPPSDGAQQAGYRYEAGTATGAQETPLVAVDGQPLLLRHARLIDERDSKTLAELRIADSAAGPVLIDWSPGPDVPSLNATVTLTELTGLAQAMQQHVPEQATVLAWWDTSRQLRLLAGTSVRFGEHLAGISPIISSRHAPDRPGVEPGEAQFWKIEGDQASARRDFDAYLSALLSPGDQGIAQLRSLADGRDAYLVIHVRDLLLLGALHPERLGVAFVDLPDTGNLHGSINQARYWARDMGYPAYTAYRIADLQPRVVALTDEASLDTLIGRLLPFHDPRELRKPVEGLTLVHQAGGFWVFRLDEG